MIIQHCHQVKKSTKEFLAEPHIGDLYVVKVAYIPGGGYEGEDTRLAGIMKLIEIDKDVLTFVISEKAYTRRGSLYLIKEYYTDEVIRLHQNDVYSFYNNDIIEEIKRE